MDAAKILEFINTAGPGAGIGLAAGLLFFIIGLPANKWVMWGRYQDMREQRDKGEKRIERLEAELRQEQQKTDELQIMVAGALALTRKNAHLATSVMQQRVLHEGEPDATEK